MYNITIVNLDCFKDGERSIGMKLKFKKPGLSLDNDTKKHRDFLKGKIRNWCSSESYDHIVVKYKGPYDGDNAIIYSGTEV